MSRNRFIQVLSLTTIIAIGNLADPKEALAAEASCNGHTVTQFHNGPCGCSSPSPPTECSAGAGGCCGVRTDNDDCTCADPS